MISAFADMGVSLSVLSDVPGDDPSVTHPIVVPGAVA
jgi:hypothetical protein